VFHEEKLRWKISWDCPFNTANDGLFAINLEVTPSIIIHHLSMDSVWSSSRAPVQPPCGWNVGHEPRAMSMWASSYMLWVMEYEKQDTRYVGSMGLWCKRYRIPPAWADDRTVGHLDRTEYVLADDSACLGAAPYYNQPAQAGFSTLPVRSPSLAAYIDIDWATSMWLKAPKPV
jgi:hypothetical protein